MILDKPLNFDRPCRKQVVVAVLVTARKDEVFIGSNWCETPVAPGECPRKGMASGEGYDLCRSVCHQPAHAEVDAIKQAGRKAIGSTVYVMGHTRICDGCQSVMKEAGVAQWMIL